ncbi:MAG: pyruvate ferredoxin oxidoreductase [Elusimicrobia bacterium RIFOXYC2_FULL_34_12]|nr:MAG: pyruvate ferredoxin oxidoreductase [Elusimicrobia bacterium RIFOXYC2_FULL_34_12]OGS38020.1 MAG: pyruvate ferredoxin oxidoreductase [Elusimicrobia bacterium RIFOXYD2_FULL_34_30]
MFMKVAKTGNEAMAEAMRQINPDVVAAYPITPATEIVMIFSQFVADGLVDTEYVAVESEHSAMSACIGASAAGARVMTSTSSQGLALMYEMLYIAAGLRLPIVIGEVNRALSAPINIHGDHSDTMGARDSGWIQIFSENSQEAYDSMIQAILISERAKLPVMVTTDGFIISHCLEVIDMIPDSDVKRFIGEYKPERFLLDIKKPYTLGAIDLQDYYFEHKMQEAEAMKNSKKIIMDVAAEFNKSFGREYGFFEKYKLDDADIAIVCLGSAAGTTKVVVDELRAKGIKAGLLKPRVFRPFPYKEIASELSKVKAISVLDRSDTYSAYAGPVFTEITSALYSSNIQIPVNNYIYGLGGRDIGIADITKVFEELVGISKTKKVERLIGYIGVRE